MWRCFLDYQVSLVKKREAHVCLNRVEKERKDNYISRSSAWTLFLIDVFVWQALVRQLYRLMKTATSLVMMSTAGVKMVCQTSRVGAMLSASILQEKRSQKSGMPSNLELVRDFRLLSFCAQFLLREYTLFHPILNSILTSEAFTCCLP